MQNNSDNAYDNKQSSIEVIGANISRQWRALYIIFFFFSPNIYYRVENELFGLRSTD